MTRDLEQIQEYNRRKIICAVHNTNDYEEALSLELGFGCEVEIVHRRNLPKVIIDNLTVNKYDENYLKFSELFGDISKKDLSESGLERLKTIEQEKFRIYKIIGKPLTLDRVLLVFSTNIFKNRISLDFPDYLQINGVNWDLTKPTLEEQSEETQREIYKLLGGEND